MKAEKWNKLSVAEQRSHLLNSRWEMESQSYIRADAIVGDMQESDTGVGYRFKRGGIIMHGFEQCPGEAFKHAETNYEAFMNTGDE